MPTAEALMHVRGRQAADALLPDSAARQADPEAAVARTAGASASDTDSSKEQEGEERTAKRLRGPVSAAELEAVHPCSANAGCITALFEHAGWCPRAGARTAPRAWCPCARNCRCAMHRRCPCFQSLICLRMPCKIAVTRHICMPGVPAAGV